MQFTRDMNIDWNQVPDMGDKLPSGIVQFKILDYEEKKSSAEGVTKKGTQKIAKYMLLMHLEAEAPDEAQGMKRDEYFVLGSDTDPDCVQAQTLYETIGAKSLKKCLSDAQVPWSNSLIATLQSSIGARFLMKVGHKMEKSNQTGEDFVGTNTGRTYKLGEIVPQYIPCLLDACDMCKAARAGGVGAPMPNPMMQNQTGGLQGAPMPPAHPYPQPVQPAPIVAPQPVAPPVRLGGQPGVQSVAPQTVAPVNPQQYAQPLVQPMTTAPQPVVASIAPAPQQVVNAPSQAPVVPSNQPAPQMPGVQPQQVQQPTQPAVQQPVQQPVQAPQQPAGHMICTICNGQVPFTEYANHMTAHAQAAQAQMTGQGGGFKQES